MAVAASRTKFWVRVSGNTRDAHLDFVQKLRRRHHTEVDNYSDCDFVLLFCPVASRVGTDVGEALNKAPDGKDTVLVVMHHTFDPDYVLAPSRRLVAEPRVRLVVDCLFYENHFLDCQRNDDGLVKVHEHLSARQGASSALIPDRPTSLCSRRRVCCVLVIVVCVVVVAVVIIVVTMKLQ